MHMVLVVEVFESELFGVRVEGRDVCRCGSAVVGVMFQVVLLIVLICPE
jgi:hypothetical protein